MKIRLEGSKDPENNVYARNEVLAKEEEGSFLGEIASMALENRNKNSDIELPRDRFDSDDLKILRLYLNRQIILTKDNITVYGHVNLSEERIRSGLLSLSEYLLSLDPEFLESAPILLKTSKRPAKTRRKKHHKRGRAVPVAGLPARRETAALAKGPDHKNPGKLTRFENENENESVAVNNEERNNIDYYLNKIPESAYGQLLSRRKFHTRKQKAKKIRPHKKSG
jgi:hypothetical protein